MNDQSSAIKDILKKYPRANLITTDLIIHKLTRLSKYLGCNLFVLRDDLTGFALGGNKTRKLEFLIGDAISKKADCVCTRKATSFSRNAAAAGKALGLDVFVVIEGTEFQQNPMSQSIFKCFDCKLSYTADKNNEELLGSYHKLLDLLKAEGRSVYELHPGGSDSIGALGYVNAFDKIIDFSNKFNIHFSDIIFSTSSAGTQAGLIVGESISGYETHITGISASRNIEEQKKIVEELAISTSSMLGIPINANKINVDDGFIGPGYALSFPESEKAIKAFAEMEGILLDSVYTGKAAAALFEYSSNKKFKGENILFIHTGGNSGIYY